MTYRHLQRFILLPKPTGARQHGFTHSQPVVDRYLPRSQSIHTSISQLRKAKIEPSPEPYKFTVSPANIQSLPVLANTNKYQGLIVGVSIMVFMAYFCWLREENDLDEELNIALFQRVPEVEEPHLAQAIPKMRERGEDTTEAETRLKELREKRLAQEKASKIAQS